MTHTSIRYRSESGLVPHIERPLLPEAHLARWAGFKLGHFESGGDLDERVHRWCNHAVVAMVSRGSAMARFRTGFRTTTTEIRAGTVGLFGPHFEVDAAYWRSLRTERTVIFLDYEASGLQGESWARRPLRQDLEIHDPELTSMISAMVEEVAAGCPHGRLYAESLSLGLAMHLHRCHADPAVAEGRRETGRLSAWQVDRMRDYVQSNLSDDIGLGDLAAQLDVSRTQFVRLFKNSLGLTPHQFVLAERVRAASRLLREGRASLAEVALAAGFSSQSHLTSVFRRSTGVTPGEFRRDPNLTRPSAVLQR
jgi:AraC family transcriptional regulator